MEIDIHLSSNKIILFTVVIFFGFSQLSSLDVFAVQRGGSMYVVNSQSQTVSPIDTNTNTVGPTITVGDPLPISLNLPVYGGAYDPRHQRMYLTNIFSNSTSVIDTKTNTLTGSPIAVGYPVGIAYDPRHQRMYVTNAGNNSVTVIDTNTNAVVGPPITVQEGPLGIAYDSRHQRMYVTSANTGKVSVIDTNTNTVATTVTVGVQSDQIWAIASDPIHNRMYIANLNRGLVSVIDTNTNIIRTPISVEGTPQAIEFDSIHGRMYVSSEGTVHKISIIDTSSNIIIDSLTTPSDAPSGIAFDPIHERLYLANSDKNTISSIDTNTDTFTSSALVVGATPISIVFALPQP